MIYTAEGDRYWLSRQAMEMVSKTKLDIFSCLG